MRRALALFVLLCLCPLAFGDSQNFSAGTGADGGGGGSAWTTPNNISSTGGQTYSVITKGSFSDNLFATNFGFSIPSGATILGISATFPARSTGGAADVLDNGIFLLKAGVATGSDHSGGLNWTGTLNYGGSTDLWNAAWLPADINAVNFGISVAASNSNPSFSRTAYVLNPVSLTVTYSGAGIGKRGVIQYSQTRTSSTTQSKR